MTLGAETDESRQQWAADMDTDVGRLPDIDTIDEYPLKAQISYSDG